jgi:hypothetical protein
VLPAAQEVLKGNTALHVANKILRQRPKIKADVQETLGAWLAKYGVELTEAALAKGKGDAARAQAAGEANALRTKGEAEATYNANVAASLTPVLIQQQYLVRWNGQLPQYILGADDGVFLQLPGGLPKQDWRPTDGPTGVTCLVARLAQLEGTDALGLRPFHARTCAVSRVPCRCLWLVSDRLDGFVFRLRTSRQFAGLGLGARTLGPTGTEPAGLARKCDVHHCLPTPMARGWADPVRHRVSESRRAWPSKCSP